MKSYINIIIITICVMGIGFFIGLGSINTKPRIEPVDPNYEKIYDELVTLCAEENEPNFVDLVQKSIESVVHISCSGWQGSGFIISPRLIKTARHVVEGTEDFTITLWDGHKLHATRAISDKTHDIGYIYIDDLTCTLDILKHGPKHYGTFFGYNHSVKLQPLKCVSAKNLRLGETTYIIGSSLGVAHFNNVTKGIVSKLDLHLENFGCPSYFGWESLYNVDAASYPGNSGGPVFNMKGEVVGVLVGGYTGADNLSLCVPSDIGLNDIQLIELLFNQDRYEREFVPEYDEYDYYNYKEDNEYYE